jgi:hypothetical protein
MTRQFFRQSLLPPFRSAALRIRGCTFSLKPLSGSARYDKNAAEDSVPNRNVLNHSILETAGPVVISSVC